MAISPQRLTIYLYSAHRAVIFAIAQLSCFTARCYSGRGIPTVCRLSVTLVDCDHAHWDSGKVISRIKRVISLRGLSKNPYQKLRRLLPEKISGKKPLANVLYSIYMLYYRCAKKIWKVAIRFWAIRKNDLQSKTKPKLCVLQVKCRPIRIQRYAWNGPNRVGLRERGALAVAGLSHSLPTLPLTFLLSLPFYSMFLTASSTLLL